MATAMNDKKPTEKKTTDADHVAMLVRIYRSARIAGDKELAESAKGELAKHGIQIGEVSQ